MKEIDVNSSYTGKQWEIDNQTNNNNKFYSDESISNPSPVEYLAGAVNSCISISAAMIANKHKLDVHNFHVKNKAIVSNLGHGKTEISTMKLCIYFDSDMSAKEKEDFIDFTLHVSTVYQTLIKGIKIKVEIA